MHTVSYTWMFPSVYGKFNRSEIQGQVAEMGDDTPCLLGPVSWMMWQICRSGFQWKPFSSLYDNFISCLYNCTPIFHQNVQDFRVTPFWNRSSKTLPTVFQWQIQVLRGQIPPLPKKKHSKSWTKGKELHGSLGFDFIWITQGLC